jgi:hypothetical protein
VSGGNPPNNPPSGSGNPSADATNNNAGGAANTSNTQGTTSDSLVGKQMDNECDIFMGNFEKAWKGVPWKDGDFCLRSNSGACKANCPTGYTPVDDSTWLKNTGTSGERKNWSSRGTGGCASDEELDPNALVLEFVCSSRGNASCGNNGACRKCVKKSACSGVKTPAGDGWRSMPPDYKDGLSDKDLTDENVKATLCRAAGCNKYWNLQVGGKKNEQENFCFYKYTDPCLATKEGFYVDGSNSAEKVVAAYEAKCGNFTSDGPDNVTNELRALRDGKYLVLDEETGGYYCGNCGESENGQCVEDSKLLGGIEKETAEQLKDLLTGGTGASAGGVGATSEVNQGGGQ